MARALHALRSRFRLLPSDQATMARVAGTLYLCGALLNLLALQLPHPAQTNEAGLYAIMGLAIVTGVVFLVWAQRLTAAAIHASMAAGAALVSLCVYFSGEVASAYATMFVWVAVVAACFFPGWWTVGHLVWLLVGYGVTIAALGGAAGFAPLTWWLLTGFALAIVSVITSWLVSGTREVEETLRREIVERERLQKELEHLAHHDSLTGLANRRRFEHELEREMAKAARRDEPLCVAALDLDGFKALNDTLGHAAGDRLLKSAASAWTEVLRGADMIARFGGDEFVVLLPEPPAEAERVVERLRKVLPAGQTCSAGMACWDGHESAGELLSRADLAMYETKKRRARLAAR